MCGRATLAMAVSRSSMKVARVTVTATTQGLMAGRSAVEPATTGAFEMGRVDIVALIEQPLPIRCNLRPFGLIEYRVDAKRRRPVTLFLGHGG